MPKPKFKETNQAMDVSEVMGPVLNLEAVISAKCLQCPTVAHESSHRLEMTSAIVSRVVLGLSTSRGGIASSRFVFPPLPSLKMLSSVALDAPLAPVSSVVGFGSFGTSAPLPSSLGGACLTLQLRPEGFSQLIFAPSHFSWVAESPISKHFQKYYFKGREGRSMQLEEDLLAESVAAMRLLLVFYS
jgi:hypothetical protein